MRVGWLYLVVGIASCQVDQLPSPSTTQPRNFALHELADLPIKKADVTYAYDIRYAGKPYGAMVVTFVGRGQPQETSRRYVAGGGTANFSHSVETEGKETTNSIKWASPFAVGRVPEKLTTLEWDFASGKAMVTNHVTGNTKPIVVPQTCRQDFGLTIARLDRRRLRKGDRIGQCSLSGEGSVKQTTWLVVAIGESTVTYAKSDADGTRTIITTDGEYIAEWRAGDGVMRRRETVEPFHAEEMERLEAEMNQNILSRIGPQ